MLAIRLQRIGRRGTAAYRLVVQDSRWSPKRGKVVAYLGSYDPHAKIATFDKDKTANFISNGALPSPKVAQLLRKEDLKLPKWVPKQVKRAGKPRQLNKKAESPATPVSTEEAPEKAPQATVETEPTSSTEKPEPSPIEPVAEAPPPAKTKEPAEKDQPAASDA